LALPFAVPFGFSNEHLGSDTPHVLLFAFVWGIGSADLIAISACVWIVVEERRLAAGRH